MNTGMNTGKIDQTSALLAESVVSRAPAGSPRDPVRCSIRRGGMMPGRTDGDAPVAWSVGCALAALLSMTVCAGPDWEESSQGDAGSLPASAQIVTGIGQLSTIRGTLSAIADKGDYQDMYLIAIDCPAAITFSAGTDPSFGGSGDFDTQLWLFDSAGFGLLANDNVTFSMGLSGFGSMSTDGTGIVVSAPGLYYIAVSGAGSHPVDTAGQPLFSFALGGPLQVSGPDGPGGANPIAGWSGPGAVGEYIIGFSPCVQFVSPCLADLDGNGVVDGADLGLLLAAWGPIGSDADLNGDGKVNGADLGILLAAWGPCPE